MLTPAVLGCPLKPRLGFKKVIRLKVKEFFPKGNRAAESCTAVSLRADSGLTITGNRGIFLRMEYLVDWAVPGDIREIMRIEEAAFAPGIRESSDVFLARLTVFPRGNTVLLAEPGELPADRRLGGYFCSELWDAAPPLSRESYALGHSMEERHRPGGRVLYISSFAADPGLRGVGRRLFTGSLEMVLRESPGVNRLLLAVNENWSAARRIYETEGFSYTGRLEGFFKEPAAGAPGSPGGFSAALIMEKNLA